MPDLLFEIGTEEIPAGYLPPAIAQAKELLAKGLADAGLACGAITGLGTPRRIVVHAAEVPAKAPDQTVEVTGPKKAAAFDAEGKPTPALAGFMRANGIADVAQIRTEDSPKGPVVRATVTKPGKKGIEVLSALLPRIVADLDFPKSMRWVGKEPTFARPIRSLAALLGEEVIPIVVGRVRAGRVIAGHPFLSPGTFELPKADLALYQALLRERYVIVDPAERRAAIEAAVAKALAPHGARIEEPELLDEVTYLVEFPFALECSFDEAFLGVPAPVLESAMTEHQRYFPVRGADGRLKARFITVINRTATQAPMIREGNERVLRARLSDARFFWESDKKKPLETLVPRLSGIRFLGKLGTILDKTGRLRKLAAALAKRVGVESPHLDRAAMLAKADLLTEMVGEFPELQGVMGEEYARAQGEPTEVAVAIREHYQPRTVEDALPATPLGAVLSLAEKFDNLAACYGSGLKPTGSQDPYALRRQAIAVVKIILEGKLSLSLRDAAKEALWLFPAELMTNATAADDLMAFFADRIYQMCVDEGKPYDLVRAALATGCDDIADFRRRLDTLVELSKMPLWAGLVEVVERTFNIQKNQDIAGEVDASLLAEPLEQELWKTWGDFAKTVEQLTLEGKYREASTVYHDAFAKPVHDFFDKVYVNVDDLRVRKNRILLLRRINHLYSKRIADLAQVAQRS